MASSREQEARAPEGQSSGAFQTTDYSVTEAPENNIGKPQEESKPPVRILLFAFMFMFQGYGVMNGNPQHVLKVKMGYPDDFQDATATFQLAKLLMRVLQIAFLVFVQPNGIVYIAYGVMFLAVLVPIIGVWLLEVRGLWIVYFQYILGGIAIGLYEGTFLSVISKLGKDTKTFVIMGCPLGFAMHNIVLGTLDQWGMPTVIYYVYTVCCLPFGAAIFYYYAPAVDPNSAGKGCETFVHSMRCGMSWIPQMIPWMVAKFAGNFVLEDAFPLLYNTFNTPRVPIWGGPDTTSPTVPFGYYTAWYWFVCMVLGDTISRRVPNYIGLKTPQSCAFWVTVAILLCIGGQSLNFLLVPIITGFACGISFFGNGFIYGLSAKYIDAYIPAEHHYAAYNLWCFVGDFAGYAGQGGLVDTIADAACDGRHHLYVCCTGNHTQGGEITDCHHLKAGGLEMAITAGDWFLPNGSAPKELVKSLASVVGGNRSVVV